MVLLQGYVVIDNVSIDGRGYYRFLIDTGSQSTTIDESIAQELSLIPTYRVMLTTPTDSRPVPATNVRTLTVGSSKAEDVEVLWYDIRTPQMVGRNIQGVLGSNFLSRFDYILDVKKGTLHLRAPRGFEESVKGERIPFRWVEGRIVVPVRFTRDGIPHDFILDSGASSMVVPQGLLETLEARSRVRLHTATGNEEVALTSVPCIFVGNLTFRNVTAAIQRTALLPAHLFESIYVNTAEGYLVLNPEFF